MTTSRDLVFLVAFMAALVVVGGAGWLGRQRVASLLTRREWVLLGKLLGIVVMLFLLLLVKISREFPAEMFIYGRF